MIVTVPVRSSPSGHYSPLRYPGGKGKLASFVSKLIRQNGLSDGMYVEPYAGGAAVALELLLTGVVRRIAINDLSRPVYEFWYSVLFRTDALIQLIETTPVNLDSRRRSKTVLLNASRADGLELGFATFFLNRTNRSGILNGGVIGGNDQSGKWKIDARFNKNDLVYRIKRIAACRRRISLTNIDAVEFVKAHSSAWNVKTLVYLDPPYHEKGRHLYYDFYLASDHANVSDVVHSLKDVSWMVSYDDVDAINLLYENDVHLKYTLNYSARERNRGQEAMFFSKNLIVPAVQGSMIEVDRCHNAIINRDNLTKTSKSRKIGSYPAGELKVNVVEELGD